MTSRTISVLRRSSKPKLRLLCFPYGGGAAAGYQALVANLPDFFECIAAEYPGHGRRRAEPLLKTVDALAEEIVETISDLADIPILLFGHSLGGAVAFETARRMPGLGFAPLVVIVSGRESPNEPTAAASTSSLSDDELIDRVKKLGGTPPEIIAQPGLIELLLPLLRTDFHANDCYCVAAGDRIDVPLRAYYGTLDPFTTCEGVDRWRDLTTASFAMHAFPGNHFFVDTCSRDVGNQVVRDVEKLLAI